MLFDFERFTVAAKLAYRRVGACPYSIDDVLRVFRRYFETYELLMETAHPPISIEQIRRIIEKMPYVRDGYVEPETYEDIIDQHFYTAYTHCDYNINHFFSGDIRNNRCYETGY